MSLDKELEGVKAPEDVTPDDLDTDDVTPEEGGDDADDVVVDPAEDGKPESKERPIENVRRELLRKQDKDKTEILAQLAQITSMVTAALASKPAEKQKTLDAMSLEELRGLRSQVPDEKKAEFDEYLNDRRIDEQVNTKINKYVESEKQKQERTRSTQLAVDRFPQLIDKSSRLYSEVNRRLASLDDNYIRYNPRIVLNLADEVASELGIAPKVVRGSRTTDMPSSVRRTEKPGARQDEGVMSDTEYEKIAARLRHAKKGGFDKKRVMARAKEYSNFNRGNE